MRLKPIAAIAGLAFGLADLPAAADTAHDVACAAALSEAQSLKGDMGVWRAKSRVLAARGADKHSTAVAADLDTMAKEHRVEELALSNRLSAATSGQFTLHQAGACPQDADTHAALLEAARFMNMPDRPSQAPLPEGLCRNSPDMSAPLVPCPRKPAP